MAGKFRRQQAKDAEVNGNLNAAREIRNITRRENTRHRKIIINRALKEKEWKISKYNRT